jgi:hypothetical protein
MREIRSVRSALLAAVAMTAGAPVAYGATITGWNTSNVAVAPTPANGVTAYSVVYDRPATDPSAVTNGRIAFTPPEAVSPGLQVENRAYELGGPQPRQVAVGCIRASSSTTCDGPFQSGKRFKQEITGTGPTDLVFNVDPQGTPNNPDGLDLTGNVGYQSFHRLVNQTGSQLGSFSLTLGTGIGGGFTPSGSGDGLGFSPTIALGPQNLNSFSQYPFGLFGNASTNPNFTLDGFFSNQRTGFNLDFAEDRIASNGYYGPYPSLFGDWMSQDQVPLGAFWDFDGDADTDALLMAWRTDSGEWEVRRGFDPLGGSTVDDVVPIAPQLFDTLADVETFLGLSLLSGDIEDLANLNVNYGILLDGFTGTSFTLRLEVTEVAPVPLPATLPLAVAGIGLLAAAGRRRRGTAGA